MKRLFALLLLGACTGEIRGQRAVGDVDVMREERPTSPSAPEPHIDRHHGAIGVRRLTRFEYANTVQDLFGVTGLEAEIPSDESVGFLPNNQNVARVGQADAEAYERLAGKVAAQAMVKLALPAGCGDCVSLPDLLLRAFRRPPNAGEVERYEQLHARLVSLGAQPLEATRGVLAAILLSPSFLYRSELESGPAMSAWDVASRLSYAVWGTLPDTELFARARDGSLLTPAERQRQARRLLSHPRAERAVLNWLYEWYGLAGAQLARKGKDVLDGLPSLAQVQAGIEEETRRFASEALLGPGGSFARLYGGTVSHLNDAVAAIYGLAGVVGKDFRKVTLDARTRRGLFTQPLVFVAHAKESGYSVVQMGRFVRERLLCQEVPPPPENVDTTLDDGPEMAGLSYREKLSLHAEIPSCRGCHRTLDPPGFAYLAYDPIGRHKPLDPRGTRFDTSGELVGVGAAPRPFADAVGMLDIVGNSQEAKGCFTRKLIEHTFGRAIAPADVPLYRRLLGQVDGPFASLLAELVAAPEFVSAGPAE